MTQCIDVTASPRPQLSRRPLEAHKGNFGRVLVVGGSRGMAGAAALAGLAALRSGAGLVQLAVPECCHTIVASFEPSYMVSALACDEEGRLSRAARAGITELADRATALACGPGLGRSADLDELVRQMYASLPLPAVLDADALNALAENPDWLARPGGIRILTPHPGEFRKLMGPDWHHAGHAPRTEYETAAVQMAERSGVVVVLKGSGTLVTDGRRLARNPTGNPGMATGGSGDVLTGLIAALLAQGMEPFDAARLGVHVHGLAGDLAAAEKGQVSLIASDLVAFLPAAFQT